MIINESLIHRFEGTISNEQRIIHQNIFTQALHRDRSEIYITEIDCVTIVSLGTHPCAIAVVRDDLNIDIKCWYPAIVDCDRSNEVNKRQKTKRNQLKKVMRNRLKYIGIRIEYYYEVEEYTVDIRDPRSLNEVDYLLNKIITLMRKEYKKRRKSYIEKPPNIVKTAIQHYKKKVLKK